MEQKLQEEQNNLKSTRDLYWTYYFIEMEEAYCCRLWQESSFTTTDFEDTAVQGQWDTDSGDRVYRMELK